jgi:hypothetical protein
MQYAYAKAIDLMWNWFIGRGVQAILALLAIICYRVYSDVLMRAAELAPFPYELFASLAFYSTKTDAINEIIRIAWRVAGQGNVDILVNIDYLSDGVSQVCF